MIQIYRKYHIAYWTIGVLLIIAMIVADILFRAYIPSIIIVLLLVIADAVFFTRLTSNKLAREVMVLFNECRANEYIDTLKKLFAGKTRGPVVSMYNMMIAGGYAVIDDYNSVYDCCQNIKSKNYRTEYHKFMIEYFINKDLLDQAQNEINELRKLLEKVKKPKYRESLEQSITNAEYAIRIKCGNYEGAQEHYEKMLAEIGHVATITNVSYSYALGKLLYLKGEPQKAKEYLQVPIELGGDTKYKWFAEDILAKIEAESLVT